MSESLGYSLRWRGRQFGPYTVQEINRKLDEHEIGMGHEIHYQNKWISVEEFILALKPTVTASNPPAQPPLSQSGNSLAQRTVRAVGTKPSSAAASLALGIPSPQPTPPRTEKSAPTAVADGEPRPRRRFVYALLAILLGFLGAHNFYARHWLTGLFQLLLSLATYLLGFGIIAPWVWALVEAVVIRKDGYGMEMS